MARVENQTKFRAVYIKNLNDHFFYHYLNCLYPNALHGAYCKWFQAGKKKNSHLFAQIHSFFVTGECYLFRLRMKLKRMIVIKKNVRVNSQKCNL